MLYIILWGAYLVIFVLSLYPLLWHTHSCTVNLNVTSISPRHACLKSKFSMQYIYRTTTMAPYTHNHDRLASSPGV